MQQPSWQYQPLGQSACSVQTCAPPSQVYGGGGSPGSPPAPSPPAPGSPGSPGPPPAPPAPGSPGSSGAQCSGKSSTSLPGQSSHSPQGLSQSVLFVQRGQASSSSMVSSEQPGPV